MRNSRQKLHRLITGPLSVNELWRSLVSYLKSTFSGTLINQKPPEPPNSCPSTMSTSDLTKVLSQLHSHSQQSPEKIASLLSKAKRNLLELNALLPTPTTPPHILLLARETLETGALMSIRLQQPDAFTRYYQQLLPFYELSDSSFKSSHHEAHGAHTKGQRSKVTALYLLLLLTKGDYAGFHTVLEGLEVEEAGKGGGLRKDEFIQYPVELERWLMEGSYDRVWGATKREGVPSEEFAVFSEVHKPSYSPQDKH